MTETFSIDSVWIVLTYKNGIEENFYLKKPRGFEFRFDKIPRLPDYRDAYKRWQRGNHFYQFVATYRYEWHEMDLRKLLVADNIELRFPPVFGQTEKYQSVDVILRNESVPRNWFGGLVVGSTDGEVVPQGSVTLEFEGVDAFSEAQVIDNFFWRQRDSDYTTDGDDDGTDPDFFIDEIYVLGTEPGETPGATTWRIAKMKMDLDAATGALLDSVDFLDLGISMGYQSDNDMYIARSKGGNIIAQMEDTSGFDDGNLDIHTFDSELNLLGSSAPASYGNKTTNCSRACYWDIEDNLYIILTREDVLRVRKYNRELIQIWETNIGFEGESTSRPAPRRHGLTMFNDSIIVIASGSIGWKIFKLNKSDGAQTASNDSLSTAHFPDIPIIERINETQFVLGFSDDFSNEGDMYVYNHDLTLHRICNLASLNTANIVLSGEQADQPFTALPNGHIVIGNKDDSRMVCFDPLTDTLSWDIEVLRPKREPQILANELLIVPSEGAVGDTDGASIINYETGIVRSHNTESFNISDLDGEKKPFAADYDDWQSDKFGKGDTEPPSPPPTDDYQGSIQITSAAQSNDPGVKPSATLDVVNEPTGASDSCGGSGVDRAFIEYKLTDYCFSIPESSKENVAVSLSSTINNDVTDLSSVHEAVTNGVRLRIESDTPGTENNLENIVLKVTSAVESDPIFNKYTLQLSGGVDPVPIDTPTEIYIGGVLFATTDNIVADEAATSIAQKVYDACTAVNQDQIAFSLNTDTVTADSDIQQDLTIELDIGNAGYTYTIQDIVKV